MKNTNRLMMGLALVCLATGSLYSAETVHGDTNAAPANQTGALAGHDRSRQCVYHQGHWWYLHASGSWDYYDGQRWVANGKARASSIVARPAVDPVVSQASYSYGSAASTDPDRYEAGQSPAAPSGNIEELQRDLAKTKQSVQRLEARLRAQEQATRGRARVYGIQAAELSELWHARQADRNFYNFGTDAYYFSGRGHFVD